MDRLIQSHEDMPLWALGLLLFALFWLAALLGRWLKTRRPPDDDDADPGLIVSASLGLLALLLGFTVSMAVARYDDRRAATLAEANAIGTFLYRTDLMPAELRRSTQDALDRYLAARIRVGHQGESSATVAAARVETSEVAAAMWRHIIAVGPQVPDPAVRILVVESANAMFDMAAARDAALGNRLPGTLVLLLILFPIASMVLIGYVSERSVGAHFMASTELILLLTLVLLLIADLNRPRSGTILTPIGPLLDVADQLKATRAAAPMLPVAAAP
jgi:hypothetical protein